MFVVSETELGTSERRWRRAPEVIDAPEMDWQIEGADPQEAPRVVVVSPHPDDETLAVGGTLSLLARRGARIEVVAVTDGEGSHPRSPTVSRTELARRRTGEQLAALAALGVDARVHRLRIPDGAVEAASLARRLAPIVAGADWVLAPFTHDGHPDHEAAGVAARLAGARVVEYLVWTWHWAKPAAASLPWSRFRRVTLDAQARVAKRLAIGCFESQIAPLSQLPGDERVLPPAVLDRFGRPFETLLA